MDGSFAGLDKYREQGGEMHWLSLGKPDWDQKPEMIEVAANRKPIGIAPHGALGDRSESGVLHRPRYPALRRSQRAMASHASQFSHCQATSTSSPKCSRM